MSPYEGGENMLELTISVLLGFLVFKILTDNKK